MLLTQLLLFQLVTLLFLVGKLLRLFVGLLRLFRCALALKLLFAQLRRCEKSLLALLIAQLLLLLQLLIGKLL